VCIRRCSQFAVCILNSELRKIRLEPDHPGRNYCVSREGGGVLQIERTVHRPGPEKQKVLSPVLQYLTQYIIFSSNFKLFQTQFF
jgi:hypothetical protein